jgi:hypothetical protein
MSKSLDRSIRVSLALTLAGLGCITGLGLLAAHSDREQMIAVAILTFGGIGLSILGVLGLLITTLKWLFGPHIPEVPNQLPDPTSPSVTPPAGAGNVPSVAADH